MDMGMEIEKGTEIIDRETDSDKYRSIDTKIDRYTDSQRDRWMDG